MQNQIQESQQANNIVLIKTSSIDAVKAYPVQAGSSMSFMHETKPYMFIKTAPSSPFEAPSVSIFKIVKVESMDEDDQAVSTEEYVTRNEYNELKSYIKTLEERIASNESVYRKPNKKWSKPSQSPNESKPKHVDYAK